MPTTVEARNMELMQTLDDAWNAQDVEIFRARHKPDVIVRWPGQPGPTVGIEDHTAESIRFWKTFPDQKRDNYTVARWSDGQIVEENLMYDLVGFLQQIGLS